MEQTIKDLTSQRERLDVQKNAIKQLPKSRGMSLAYTALEKGRMYIGEVCRELGKTYPYEDTKKAVDAKGIQDAVDLSNKKVAINSNEVISLNDIREDLDKEANIFLETINKIKVGKLNNKFAMDCAASEAYRGLKETRMWLGIRLGDLRDIENNKSKK